MPWFAWIAIIGIIMFTVAQIVSMKTGRPLPGGSQDQEELEELRKRLDALEKDQPAELEEPRIPTKAEENLAAEDRWRLDMLEARLENLETQPPKGNDDGDEGGRGVPPGEQRRTVQHGGDEAPRIPEREADGDQDDDDTRGRGSSA